MKLAEEAIAFVDAAVFSKSARHLSEVETVLLRGAWQGKTYEQIEETCQYSLAYLKQAAGPKLWKLLTETLGEEVNKTNFRVVLERQVWQKGAEGEKRAEGAVGRSPSRRMEAEGAEGDKGDKGDKEAEEQRSRGAEEQRRINTHHLPLTTHSQLPTSDSRLPTSDFRLPTPDSRLPNKIDWGEAPDTSIFYGRDRELATLQQWIVNERCRLVTIVGMAGIGKTTLAVCCARQIQGDFECIVWRSLRHAPSIQELLNDLIGCLSEPQVKLLAVDDPIAQLLELLRQHRCLLVLDRGETILRQGELAGYYDRQHAGYKELLSRIGQTPHQSCLILTSLEKPREIAALEGNTLPVRSLQLSGLQAEAREILKEKNLSDERKWEDLIHLYRGNPLALKIVAATIQDLFAGKVSEFLKQNTIVFGDLRDLLEEQFERLSKLEIEILYWLVLESKPVTILELRNDLLLPISHSDLIDALESLLRRTLIETIPGKSNAALFTLQQPVVKEYFINQFIQSFCQELQQVFKIQEIQQIELLRNHALVKKGESNTDKQRQANLIFKSIKDRLCVIFRDERLIESQLEAVLLMLQDKSNLVVGYARDNLQNLILFLRSEPLNYK